MNSTFFTNKDFAKGIKIIKITTYKFNKRSNDFIVPALNPFTLEGLVVCLISDVNNLREENKSTQKSTANLRNDFRKIIQEELAKFRGYI
jgi:hypothetical protein